MEVKMMERQALLYEARKKKLFRAFIMTCMWGGFGFITPVNPLSHPS